MIHFPHLWLLWLEETSSFLRSKLEPWEDGRVPTAMPQLEFRIHTSLFAARKIEEATGVALELDCKKMKVLSWPVSEERKSEICRSPDPDFGTWYQLRKSQDVMLSYKRIIDVFVHARICSFTCVSPTKNPMKDIGVFVASDHTMKDRVLFVSVGAIDAILRHTIEVFRPAIERRDKRMAQRSAIRKAEAISEKRPNKAPEPTPGAVTPRATEGF